MKERPILFSTPMIQAIMAGRKTQTRRIVKPQPSAIVDKIRINPVGDNWQFHTESLGFCDYNEKVKCPYGQTGDILWVRESFWPWNPDIQGGSFAYKADFEERYGAWERDTPNKFHDVERVDRWKPSIHMPKEAARIWLEVTDIKAERLQDISEEDAVAEGVFYNDDEAVGRVFKDYMADASGYGHPDHDFPWAKGAKESFTSLWASINGEESWNVNPWVWAVTFKVISTTGKPESMEAPVNLLKVLRKAER